MTAPKPTPPKPWISGFCGKGNPPDSHQRCRGTYEGRPCKCPHHAAERLLAHATGLHHSADAVLTFDLEGIDWEATVRVAAELAAARKAVSAAEEFLAKHAGAVWPGPWREQQVVEGVGTANPYRTADRVKWDDDGLVKKVVERRMAAAGGVQPDPLETARWITDAAAFSYWRVGKLADLGIDVDEYRAKKRGNVRLRITTDHMVGDTTREAS